MRIARCTAVWISGQGNLDDYESYVWDGVNWIHVIRPKLVVSDKLHAVDLDLSKISRTCRIRTTLQTEDAEKIIAAFAISEDDLHNYNMTLEEVPVSNPVRLEEIRDNK